MKKIGILGGTFNPVHTGHLLLAEGIREGLNLDSVLFIPSFMPPHKKSVKLASAKDRLALVRLAIKGNPYFKVSTIEIKRGGKSYSADTLEGLHKFFKNNAEFFFIIGSDNVSELKKWKSIDRLMKLCSIVTAVRPGYKIKFPKVKVVDIPTLPVSSTDIRQLVNQGKTIKYLVPETVRKYILKNRLYR